MELKMGKGLKKTEKTKFMENNKNEIYKALKEFYILGQSSQLESNGNFLARNFILLEIKKIYDSKKFLRNEYVFDLNELEKYLSDVKQWNLGKMSFMNVQTIVKIILS